MGGKSSKAVDDSEIVNIALNKVQLKVFAGFESTERRLLFDFSDNFTCTPTLFTVLSSGKVEGNASGKQLKPLPMRGLLSYNFAQYLEDDAAVAKCGEHLDAYCVWNSDQKKYALCQAWTVNFNDDFKKEFAIEDEYPDSEHFEEEAVATMKHATANLFGEEARAHKLKFCTKKNHNIFRTFVGTPSQFNDFFAIEGVKEHFDIISVQDNQIEVTMFDKQGRKKSGSQILRFGDTPDVEHVLYWRKGFTSFWSFKSRDQFDRQSKLYGQIGGNDADTACR